MRFDHTHAWEHADRVTVAVYYRDYVLKPGEACTLIGIIDRRTVNLHQALGSRKLIHAAVTAELPKLRTP